jgi:membrane-associated HD superfamily phosphohydrolase
LCRVARLFYKDIGMMVAPSFRAENKKSRAALRCAGSPGFFYKDIGMMVAPSFRAENKVEVQLQGL